MEYINNLSKEKEIKRFFPWEQINFFPRKRQRTFMHDRAIFTKYIISVHKSICIT